MTAWFIKILLDFTSPPPPPPTENSTRKVRQPLKTLVDNPTQEAEQAVVHLGHVPAVRSMPTCLSSLQVLIHTGDGPRGEYKKVDQ